MRGGRRPVGGVIAERAGLDFVLRLDVLMGRFYEVESIGRSHGGIRCGSPVLDLARHECI